MCVKLCSSCACLYGATSGDVQPSFAPFFARLVRKSTKKTNPSVRNVIDAQMKQGNAKEVLRNICTVKGGKSETLLLTCFGTPLVCARTENHQANSTTAAGQNAHYNRSYRVPDRNKVIHSCEKEEKNSQKGKDLPGNLEAATFPKELRSLPHESLVSAEVHIFV